MATTGKVAIVLDNGSDTSKNGFAGAEDPISVFPTMTGRPRHEGMTENLKDSYVGEEAQSNREILSLKRPIERGIIANWDDMETIWRYTFQNELKVNPAEHAVLLTESPTNPSANREKTAQIMFETFNTPATFMANQAVLALYASGNLNGVVLDSGHGATHVVPVHNGYAIHDAIKRMDFAGDDLTNYFTKILTESGVNFTTNTDRNAVRGIKEKLCYVEHNFDTAMKSSTQQTQYNLPDGQNISVGKELFRCPESLFQPSALGAKSPGIQQSIFNSIMHCEENIRKDLFATVVLAGGSTLFRGLPDRLQKELLALAPGTNVNVLAEPKRLHTVWIGGSILGSLPDFKEKWISKKDYEEHGSPIIHKKCY